MTDVDNTTNPPDKCCSKCLQVKLAAEFGKNSHNKVDGLQSWCRDCRRQYRIDNAVSIREKKREHSANHADYIREYKRKYRQNNFEKVDSYQKEYRQSHADAKREYNKQYYSEHADKIRRQKREYRRKNAAEICEYGRHWRKVNPRKQAVGAQRKRARKRELPNNFTSTNWESCLKYFEHKCAVCGRPAGLWHFIAMDHWIPLSSPNCPGTVATNIAPLCHHKQGGSDGCNNSKSSRDPIAWLTEQYGNAKANRIMNKIAEYFNSLHDD